MAGRLSFADAVLAADAPWTRRVAAVGLLLAVVVVHGCLAERVADRIADLNIDAAMPQRIEVTYVRELAPSAPPALAPAPPVAVPRPARRRAPARAAEPPASAASAPVPTEAVAEAAPMPVPVPVPAEPPPTAEPPPAVAAAPSPAASGPPAYEWPGSTRLSYALTGNYRGEINGTAQVEWVRIGMRYQVHLDVTVGLPFAPLLTRRMTSDGRLTPQGLYPERYDEENKQAFRERRRVAIRFEDDGILMPDGRRRERWPGVQDAASQFVQLSYLFTTRPELLAPGRTVEVPLALPRNVDRWVYDVLEMEPVATPFGAVDAYPLKPRRVASRGSDLTAEIWFAPTLANLPVRIRIRQDAETFIDLVIRRRPQLAAP